MCSGSGPKSQAAGIGDLCASGEVVLQTSDLTGIDASVQKQSVQIKLDGVDRGEAEGSPGQGVLRPAHWPQEMCCLAILVRQEADILRRG